MVGVLGGFVGLKVIECWNIYPHNIYLGFAFIFVSGFLFYQNVRGIRERGEVFNVNLNVRGVALEGKKKEVKR